MAKTEVTGAQIKDGTVSLTADVTGVLPVANGGSGSNTLALNNVLLGNGTGAVQVVAPGTAGNVLKSDGTTWTSGAVTTSWSNVTDKPTYIAAGSTQADARAAISAASLDNNGKVPVSELPNSIMEYQGTWNASTNTPTLANGTGNAGDVYRVSVGGTRNLGAGNITFDVGDYAIYNGSTWEKADTTDAVSTVAGRTGDVTLTFSDIGGTLTANTTGSAASLTTARTVRTDLASTSTASFDGTANITPGVTGTLAVTNGGTGVTSLTSNAVVIGNGTGAVQVVAPGTSGNLLTSDGTTWASTTPTFYKRLVSTITASTTLGSTANTDYVTFWNGPPAAALLLHMDGANNSTTFTDSSPNALTVTANSGAKISTAQSKFGGASGLFNGTSDYLSSASNSLFTFTGNFTIEAWVRTSSQSLNYSTIIGSNSTTYDANACALLNYGTSPPGGVTARAFNTTMNGGAFSLTGTTLAATNTWYHVALTRSGSTVRLFVNGTQEASGSYSSTVNWSNNGLNIGRNGWDGAASYWNGYIDELRVVNGVAVYTSNFTAPTDAYDSSIITLPTAVSNTNRMSIRNIISAGSVRVNTTSSQTVDGASSVTLAAGSTTELISDGSNWRTI